MADILVVDDDEVLRETLRLLLEDEGHTVYEVPDGPDALVALRAHLRPMVVLLDWLLPSMDGIQVLQAIATKAPPTHPTWRHAFLLMTAATIDEQHPLPSWPPDQDVTLISKPFDVDELVAQIDAAVVRIAASCHAGHSRTTSQPDAHRG